jgi:Flp pilus assembly protein TadD
MYRQSCIAALVFCLAACAAAPPPKPAAPPPDTARILAGIQAAGEHEQSAIDVMPLTDPGVATLRQAARSAVITGHYDIAAARLAQALKLHPDSPELLQDQAELAIRTHDWAEAERLAYRSWQAGPRLGPLCAKNWQTILEMRRIAGNEAGVETARKGVGQCHVEGVHRY